MARKSPILRLDEVSGGSILYAMGGSTGSYYGIEPVVINGSEITLSTTATGALIKVENKLDITAAQQTYATTSTTNDLYNSITTLDNSKLSVSDYTPFYETTTANFEIYNNNFTAINSDINVLDTEITNATEYVDTIAQQVSANQEKIAEFEVTIENAMTVDRLNYDTSNNITGYAGTAFIDSTKEPLLDFDYNANNEITAINTTAIGGVEPYVLVSTIEEATSQSAADSDKIYIVTGTSSFSGDF